VGFRDRRDAGRRLAKLLRGLKGEAGLVVLALPRGGVPVAYEVASELKVPLDVFLVRKLGLPGREEYALGAIASGGVRVLNPDLEGVVSLSALERETRTQQVEMERQEALFRPGPPVLLKDASVVLVDDGLATGSTMRAAVLGVRAHKPRTIRVAVPVGAPPVCEEFRALVDDVTCVLTPSPFISVGRWYEDFTQTTDQEVHTLLLKARASESARAADRAHPR